MSILNFLLEIVNSGVVDNKQSGSATPINTNTTKITLNESGTTILILLFIVCFISTIVLAVKYRNLKRKIKNNEKTNITDDEKGE